MSDNVKSPDVVFMQNLTVITAALELGGCTLARVAGGDEIANTVNGEIQEKINFQELLAARLSQKLGV